MKSPHDKGSLRSATRRLPILVVVGALLTASAAIADESARKLVALLDYLGSDYKNAVRGGKVTNQDEYAEMQEFAKRSLDLSAQLQAVDKSDKGGIKPILTSLAERIANKADAELISALAGEAKAKLIAAYNIIPYPKTLPTLADGKKIFDDNCAQCHGPSGRGDGPGRESMNPKTPPPANFHDPERMAGLSPFKVFNTASFGIDGTAMTSFNALPEEQRWEVAFYVLSLRFSTESASAGGALLQSHGLNDLSRIATLATHTDEQLVEKLKPYAGREFQTHAALAYLRRGVLEKKISDPLRTARTRLSEAAELYTKGEKEAAYQKAVEAYLDGFELAEPTLFARDASFGRGLEEQFTQFRNAIKQGAPAEAIQRRRLDIESLLDQASRMIARDDAFTGYYTFANSALIILREGLEAALILAAILAMLRVVGATQAIRYVHLGWILALFAGLLTWLATESVLTLSGRHRESMEGFISLFAAVALFYVGYWLHTRSEARKWHALIQEKVKDLVSTRKILGLVGLSFFAVYREAFEVVLFYHALWLQGESNHTPVVWGFAMGSAALALATFAIFKLGVGIPLKYFFGATGALLYIMAFIFAGNGVKELQTALWLPTTPVRLPTRVPILGIYPTVESLTAQAAMLLAFIGASLWLSRKPSGGEP